VPGFWAKRLDEIPTIAPDAPDDPLWYPLQHHFGISAFGVNVYAASRPGIELIGEHDETASGQEEVYVVISGSARFELDGEALTAPAVTVVAVRDPAVRRAATAVEPETHVVAVGGRAQEAFESSWRAAHFEGVPTAAG
jgi:hypothetical protein